MLASFLSGEFLLHIPCWLRLFNLFLSVEFVLHIPCWTVFSVGSFSYRFIADFVLMWGVSLTHPVLASSFFFFFFSFFFFSFSFLYLFYLGSFPYTSPVGFFSFLCLGSFSYTSHVGFTILWGVSLTHSVMASFFFFFFFIWGVSVTHPMLDLLFFEEFFVHIHC